MNKNISFQRKTLEGEIENSKALLHKLEEKGSGRKVKSEELDELLFHWFIDARSLKSPVDNQSIIIKAIQIKEDLLAEAKNVLEKARLEDDEEIIKKKLTRSLCWIHVYLEKIGRKNLKRDTLSLQGS